MKSMPEKEILFNRYYAGEMVRFGRGAWLILIYKTHFPQDNKLFKTLPLISPLFGFEVNHLNKYMYNICYY